MTPRATRPMERTSLSANRMHLPELENSMMSCLPSVRLTLTSSSSSGRSIAQMPLARGREYSDSGVFLTIPWRVAKKTNRSSGNSRTGRHRVDALFLFQRQQVDDGLAAADVAGLGQLVDLQPVDSAATGEAQQRVVRVGDEQLVDEIFVLDPGRRLAGAAAPLGLVAVQRLRLGITGM